MRHSEDKKCTTKQHFSGLPRFSKKRILPLPLHRELGTDIQVWVVSPSLLIEDTVFMASQGVLVVVFHGWLAINTVGPVINFSGALV